jgi:hypothetical protein
MASLNVTILSSTGVSLNVTLILDDSHFFYSEIDKSDFIEKHFDLELIADVFLHSRNVLDSVLQTFKDTPVEDKIVAFKDAILKNYKLYDDWFQCQSSINLVYFRIKKI